MTNIIPILLTIVPIPVEPYPTPTVICQEVTMVLLEAVEQGVIEQKQAEEISSRCFQNFTI